MNSCLIIGGGGYIGYRWACRLVARQQFDSIVLADLHPPLFSSSRPDRFSRLRRAAAIGTAIEGTLRRTSKLAQGRESDILRKL